MSIQAINPATGDVIATHEEMTPQVVAGIVNSVTVTPSGNVLNVSASLPEDVFTQLLKPASRAAESRHPRVGGAAPRNLK